MTIKTIKKLLWCLAIVILASPAAYAADDAYSRAIEAISSNNLTLKAARENVAAGKASNMTGLTLENPEVGFAYQWATAKGEYDKINVEVTQTFDFPTLSGAKRKVADEYNGIVDIDYAIARNAVMGEADRCLTMLAYYCRVCNFYDGWLSETEKLAEMAKKALDEGNMNIVDYNIILLQKRTIATDLEILRIDYASELENLKRLNGNQPMRYDTPDYASYQIPASFDAFYQEASARSLPIARARGQVSLSDRQLSLSKSNGLPKFTIGYTNELVRGSNYHGVTTGMSLPLWGNRGAVKAAKAAKAAAEVQLDDVQMQFEADMRVRYSRAVTMSKMVADYEEIVRSNPNSKLLAKSLELGHTSIIDYLTEKKGLYDMELKGIEIMRDYQLALCDLRAPLL